MKDSSVMSHYFGIERQFARNFLLRVNYQGSMGRHLSQLMNLNRFDGSMAPGDRLARPWVCGVPQARPRMYALLIPAAGGR